jgi:hypothetical protein
MQSHAQTAWGAPKTVRDRARRAFRAAGRGYVDATMHDSEARDGPTPAATEVGQGMLVGPLLGSGAAVEPEPQPVAPTTMADQVVRPLRDGDPPVQWWLPLETDRA